MFNTGCLLRDMTGLDVISDSPCIMEIELEGLFKVRGNIGYRYLLRDMTGLDVISDSRV